MTILESTSLFITNGLGGSYVLRDIYTYVLPDNPKMAEKRLEIAASFIDEWRSMHDKINDLIRDNKLKQSQDLLRDFSRLCEEVGSSSDISLQLEIDNKKWESE